MKWFAALIALIAVGVGARVILNLQKRNHELKVKVDDYRNIIEHLKVTIADDERKLDKVNMHDRMRIDNLDSLVISKQKQVESIEARILELKQNPDAAKAKQDAQSDLKLQKEKVDSVQAQIKDFEQSKSNLKSESNNDQQSIEDRFRTQDSTLAYKIKSAEDQQRALEAELRAIKVVRNDPVALNEKNSKAQEIVNQKAYLSDLRKEKRELVYQHSIQKTEIKAGLSADQSQVEQQLTSLKSQLKDEKARYDVLDKTLKSFANAETGMKNQLKALQDQKQNLEREISELKASR